jgi:DNA-binding response OmpR family regulator
MVKQLAELHGGTVAVASAEGKGACFVAWLPLRDAAQSEASEARLVDTSPGLPGNLRYALLVEDDDATADLVRDLLEGEGFSVVRAANTPAALLLAPLQPLSLITLDLELPRSDSWDFILHLRDSALLARVPVVMIAASSNNNITVNGGAATVLQKPITRGQLMASIAHLGLQPQPETTYQVLVVDDDRKAVELIAAFLPQPEYAVVRAYGGADAITLAQRLQPDLILLDLMMPGVSGFDVVDALQRDSRTSSIPILVVTAKHVTAGERAAILSGGGGAEVPGQNAAFDRDRFVSDVRRVLQYP